MTITAKPEHIEAAKDIEALMIKHGDKLTGLELLAVASNIVGKMISLQDSRFVSAEMAMGVVIQNIKIGHKQAIAELKG